MLCASCWHQLDVAAVLALWRMAAVLCAICHWLASLQGCVAHGGGSCLPPTSLTATEIVGVY